MFRHLNTSNLVVLDSTIMLWDIAIIVDYPAGILVHALSLGRLLGKCHLFLCQGTTGGDGSSLGSLNGQGAPSTANIQMLFSFLQMDGIQNAVNLALLAHLQGLSFVVLVVEDARGVDHRGAQEPSVKVIATVVHVSNLNSKIEF